MFDNVLDKKEGFLEYKNEKYEKLALFPKGLTQDFGKKQNEISSDFLFLTKIVRYSR